MVVVDVSVVVGCSAAVVDVVEVSGSSSVPWLEHADAVSRSVSKMAESRFMRAGYPGPPP